MKYHFGEKIRSVRERRGMTIKKAAEQAELSESMLSQIERNRVSPAIDTLIRISMVLDIDFNYLFSDLRKKPNIHLVRQDERRKLSQGKVAYQQLSGTAEVDDNPEHALEAYFLEVAIGGEKGDPDYGHPGQELGIILEGEGELIYGDERLHLHPGDSVSFRSNIPHRLKNTGDKILKAYWVTTPPKSQFRS